jgi:hypothetical protein
MTNKYTISNQEFKITQNNNHEEQSCANKVQAFFSNSCRKICTEDNIKSFLFYGMVAVSGFAGGMILSSDGKAYSESSYITMRETEYSDRLYNTRIATATATACTCMVVRLIINYLSTETSCNSQASSTKIEEDNQQPSV